MNKRQPSRTPPADARSQPAPPPGGTASAGTVILFSVRIRHSYYNLANDRCPDFKVVPTPDCAALMSRLGIMFHDQDDGFVVTVPQSRLPALTSHVTSTFNAAAAGYGYWARLTFFLVLKNPAFVGITALPIDTNPTQQNLYASNLQTHGRGGQLLLGAAPSLGAGALYPVTQATLPLQTTADATVTATDISGRPVASANTPTALSLAGSPYGLYTVSCVPASAYSGPSQVAYVPPRPLTSGLIDLLLAQPVPGTGNSAAFPIGPLPVPPPTGQSDTVPSVRTVSLVLPFDSRKTTWQYYVVSQGTRGRFAPDLSITGSETTFQQASAPVTLPNGEQAILFSSATALPLRQRSPYRFKLSGQRQGPGGSRDDISIDRLPCAPAAPVWPAPTGDAVSGASEIFVHV